MSTCCCCGHTWPYGGSYCDTCNEDRCLALDENGDTYCKLRDEEEERQ